MAASFLAGRARRTVGSSAAATRPRDAEQRVCQAGQPSFDVTEATLQGDGSVLSAPWWKRAALSGAGQLTNELAVYCVFDGAQSEPVPVYVGETSRLSARAASHLAARWPMGDPWIAYRAFPGAPKHVLHELESDVLGLHFLAHTGSAILPVPR
jgi:hypothetical protein